MGMGGRVPVRAERLRPPFTVSEIKKAIPPHCFQRSLLRSSYYLVHDLVLASLLYYIATTYFQQLTYPLQYLAWTLYMICQGFVLMGVWVIAHECGHHAYSNYQWLDDTLGLILHSLLLVPYFSWKISHRRHHANTGSLDRDEVFVPKTKHDRSAIGKFVDESPMLKIILRVTIGWPFYLLFNISGRKYERFTNHFDPYSPLFSDSERAQILITDIGFVAAAYGLYRVAIVKGFLWVMGVYGVPLSIVNGFLVTLTYLHHTHAALPHFDSSEWNWLRGALATVDRDYGILNHLLHHITDTHVAHHLFSNIPHYHAMEATKAIKPVLGKYYNFDRTPILKAIWREAKECVYIEPDQDENLKGVYWYTNKP